MKRKLDSVTAVNARIGDWVREKCSLAEMVRRLQKLGVDVSDMTVLRRIRSLGLTMENRPVAARTGQGPWLTEFRLAIVALADERKTYPDIWDHLAKANPEEPRLQRPISREAKSSAIAAWVHDERRRRARPRRRTLLGALTVGEPTAPRDPTSITTGRDTGGADSDSQSRLSIVAGPVSTAPTQPSTGMPGKAGCSVTFDLEARRRETDAMSQANRDAEIAATTAEQKEKAAALRRRLGQ